MKKIWLRKSTRRKLSIDELRMLCVNLRSHETKNILFEYIEGNFIESVLEITRDDTKDLKNLTVQQKNEILKQYDLTRGSAKNFMFKTRKIHSFKTK